MEVAKLTMKLMANTTFEGIAREWLRKMQNRWVPTHHDRIERRLERDIFPFMGNRPISDNLSSSRFNAPSQYSA